MLHCVRSLSEDMKECQFHMRPYIEVPKVKEFLSTFVKQIFEMKQYLTGSNAGR